MFIKTCPTIKFLLHDSHGIRTSEDTHGGTHMQSLHACSHLSVTSLRHPLLQPLQTYDCHRTCNNYNHMVMTFDFFIKKVNSLFRLDLSIKHYVFTIYTRKQQFYILYNIPEIEWVLWYPLLDLDWCLSFEVTVGPRDLIFIHRDITVNWDRPLF